MSNQITPNPSVPTKIVAEVKFPRWINNLGIIPTSYKDSMSYYECLAWLCKFLEETVIPSVNENGEAVEELQALYVELNNYVTHYFETLDVQEEINNKLDEMADDGTLTEIVGAYLQTKAVFGFDTVADMKEGTNLINGSYARTLGYSNINDMAGGLYKIRTITNQDVVDEKNIISITASENLIAELIKENELICFDTVANMKASNKLVDGMFAKTLGYYEANDGGSALYKIREIENEETADEEFLIEIDETLVAELICDTINVKQLGAKGNGTNDDAQIFQDAFNHAKNAYKKVIVPEGTYSIQSGLTAYNKINVEGEGVVILDFSEIETNDDYCIAIESSGILHTQTRKNNSVFKNITFKGYDTDFTDTFPAENDYSTKALFYITTFEFELTDLSIYGFNKVFTYGSNSYIINVKDSIMSHNNYVIYYDQTGIINTGERLSFDNCVIGNNRVAIHNYLGMLSFINCSFDYNLKIADLFTSKVSGTSSGRSSFMGCHFEDTNELVPRTVDRFVTDTATIDFVNNTFWFNKLPFIKEANTKTSYLKFINNDFRSNDYDHYFVENAPMSCCFINNDFITRTTSALKLYTYQNNINQTYASFIATATDGAIAKNNSDLEVTSNAYVTAYGYSEYIEIPKGYASIWFKFDFIGASASTKNKNWVTFYDAEKNVLSSVSSNFDVETTSKTKYFNSVIPDNAKYLRLLVHSPISGGKTTYSNLYADFS